MSNAEFELAGAELDWPLMSAAGMTNHPDMEATANRIENLATIGLPLVMGGSITLGDIRGGNGYIKTPTGWEYAGGDEHFDLEAGALYNSKGLANTGSDRFMKRLPDLLDSVHSHGSELAISFSPHSGTPQEELKEILVLSEKALKAGVLYVEINLSCPNVKDRPPFYLDPEALTEFNEYLASQKTLLNKYGHPGIYLKYGPIEQGLLDENVHLLEVPSVGGRVVSNTLGGQKAKTSTGEDAIKVNGGKAGMSGPAMAPLGQQNTAMWGRAMKAHLEQELISSLGVHSGQEVLLRRRLGANAVQLGSVIYAPKLIGCETAAEAVEKIKTEIIDLTDDSRYHYPK